MSEIVRALRSPVARHGQLRTAGPVGTVAKLVGIILSVALVSVVSVAAIAVGRTAGSVHQVDLGDAGDIPTVGAASGAVDVLLVGSDARTGQKGSYGTDPGSTLNDVNILLHVSADHSKATVISFPRDLYVDRPACSDPRSGRRTGAKRDVKINSVLGDAGVACVRDTVEELTGRTIPYLALITFDGVVQMSNAVGGVPVCVAQRIDDDYTELHLSRGEHVLKGVTALKFLRTRHGVGNGSDLTRISSQQVFLSSLVRMLKSNSTLTDLAKLYGVATAVTRSMTLSTSIANPEAVVSLARAVAPIDLDKVVFVQYPTTEEGDGVVANRAAAKTLMSAVAGDRTIRLTKPSGDGAGGAQVDDAGSTPSPSSSSATPSSSASPDDPVTLPAGISGQTAAQRSCSVGNDLGSR